MSRKVLHSKEGGSMQIGIIGAGRVGCSMGKYLVEHGADVLGYVRDIMIRMIGRQKKPHNSQRQSVMIRWQNLYQPAD